MKPVKAWAVVFPDGEVSLCGIDRTRREAKSAFQDMTGAEWSALKRQGYTCRRVVITEAEPAKRKGRGT